MSLLERKFFDARGSAQFMFDFTDKLRSFAALTIISCTVEHVSSLLQKVDGCVFPVSKYFLLICYEKCKRQLVKSLEAAAEATTNLAI